MADALSRNYRVLTPPERFTLAIEAMARGDDAEFDRLQDTCPKLDYRHNDAEYRDRLQRGYLIALLACLNLRSHLALIRGADVFREQHRLYARGPTLVHVTRRCCIAGAGGRAPPLRRRHHGWAVPV